MVNTSNISQLDYTLDLVSGLSDEELKAVQSVALVFLKKNNIPDSIASDEPIPFKSQTEKQLLDRIDHSLAQIKTGQVWDAEDVEEELLRGLDE